MKYILNETPVKTTNNFDINNISVDLDLNIDYKFNNYSFEDNEDVIINETLEDDYSSNIGLKHDKYKKLVVNANKDLSSCKTLIIKYNSEDTNAIIDEITFNLSESSKLSVLMIYKLKENVLHDGTIKTNLGKNAKLNLTLVNEASNTSSTLIDINSSLDEESDLKINVVDFYGSKRIYRSNGITNRKAKNTINMIFGGKNNELIDINYYLSNENEYSQNYINVEGSLFDKAIKHFKGTVDFKEGSNLSIGKEKENTLLLSNDSVSKSLPLMLCHEENVEGSHAVSTGKPDLEKLFYLESRGISYMEALNMMIKANYSFILKEVPSDIEEYIELFIDSYLN